MMFVVTLLGGRRMRLSHLDIQRTNATKCGKYDYRN